MKKLIVASLLGLSALGAQARHYAQNGACDTGCPVAPACPVECPKPICTKTVMVPKQIMVPKTIEVPALKKVIKQPATCERVPEYYKVPLTVYETRCRYKTVWHPQPDVVYYECPVDTACCPTNNACPVAC